VAVFGEDRALFEPLVNIVGQRHIATVEPPIRRMGLGLVVAGAVALAAGSIVLFISDPADSDLYPPCPFRALTGGLYCPGCGTTRALHELLHGHLGEAFGLNPLMMLVLPLLGYSLLSWARFAVTGRALPAILVSPLWGWLVLVIVLAYWVLRNISLYPFYLLAP
jgi:Protein of unknown function (DUF2752)